MENAKMIEIINNRWEQAQRDKRAAEYIRKCEEKEPEDKLLGWLSFFAIVIVITLQCIR